MFSDGLSTTVGVMNVRTLLALLVFSLTALQAHAHVTVWPRESTAGAYEKYVVRVPTEGKVATSSIELMIPEGLTFVSIGAPSGFTYELKRTGERVTSIVWSRAIAPGEFAEFAFMARNPQTGDLTWKATQRFIDGTRTEWIGPRGDRHPASVTTLKPR
jgi:uncharacterized protein YcnI